MDIINPYIHGGEAAPAAFDGFGNRSRNFNGVDDEVIIPDSPSFPTGAQTWSCWVKPSRLTFGASGQDMLSKWGSQGANGLSAILFLANTGLGKPQFYISDNGSNVFLAQSSDPLTVDTWHHVVGVFTPNTSMKIYVDGVLKGTNTTSIPAAIHNSSVDFVIGWRDFTFDAHFKGNICDCRIYDTDLTATDISDLYNGTNITTNLIGHWLTDADDVEDKAGSNNGTNYGTKYSYDNPSPPVEFGRASRSFNGSSDYITAPDGSWIPTGAQTWACWVKYNSSGTYAFFNHNGSSPNRSIQIVITTGNKIQFQVSDDGTEREDFQSVSTISQGDWHHIACVFNPSASTGQGRRIYINGVLDQNGSTNYTLLHDTNQDVGMGANGAGLFKLDGSLADCRIYDADIGDAGVSDLYNGTDVQTNLVGHWLTDNDDVEDKAGTNDGTNFGSTYSYEAPLPANKLIDTYASTCGAYSLRELTTDWAGLAVVNVRRVSDGSTSDFTSSEITDGTLASFCGTQGGFVNTVYDQSGNGFDLIQPTEGFQPRIYTGATQSVSTLNGKPCLDFSSGAYLYNSNSFDYEGGVSWYSVLRNNLGPSNVHRIWCDDITGTQGYLSFTANTHSINDGGGYTTYNTTGQITNQQQLLSYNLDESQGSYVYGYDGSSTSGTLSGWTGSIEISGTSANIGVMGAGNGGQTLTGLWQELIVYPNDQLHNKQNIERNINEFYGIY